MPDNRINSFVATLDELLRFLKAYEDDLFYFDINAEQPPPGARVFDITTFSPEDARRVLANIHPGDDLPRLTPAAQALIGAQPKGQVACGLNIQPRDNQGWPSIPADFRQVGWVRFPFMSSIARFPSLQDAFAFYDPVIEAYSQLGSKILLVLTHEAYGEGVFNWGEMNSQRWREYTAAYADVATQIFKRYAGKIAAYEIWNEGDVDPGNPAAVAFPPADYANFLATHARLVRTHAPGAQVVMQGLVHSTSRSLDYMRQTLAALDGRLPVDAIALHPYGKGAPDDNTPFSRFGDIGADLDAFRRLVPGQPIWLTEVGATGASAPQHKPLAARYLSNLYTYLARAYADIAPVVIWYAWSDAMHVEAQTNGLVGLDGQPNPAIYEAFFEVACS